MTEVLQSIKASDMTPMLQRIFESEGGSDILDTIMKYLYKGMSSGTGTTSNSRHPTFGRAGSSLTPQSTGFSQHAPRPGGGESSGAAMSVLLSWHEKVVEVAGLGCIGRVMSDRRKV
jgi:actin related protein 2/3 complex subunit 5